VTVPLRKSGRHATACDSGYRHDLNCLRLMESDRLPGLMVLERGMMLDVGHAAVRLEVL
jgi:hypothetical protein